MRLPRAAIFAFLFASTPGTSRAGDDLSETLAFVRDAMGQEAVVGFDGQVEELHHEALALIIGRDAKRGAPLESYDCNNTPIDSLSFAEVSGELRLAHRACRESMFLRKSAPGFRTLGSVRLSSAKIAGWLAEAERESNVPVRLLDAIIRYSSGFRPGAISEEGRVGLMQLDPHDVAREGIPFRDLTDPRENIRVGAQCLRRLMYAYTDLRLALAAFRSGREAVAKADGMPPDRETMFFVRETRRLFYATAYAFPNEQGAEHMAYVWKWLD